MNDILGARLILDQHKVYYVGEPVKGKLFLIPTKDIDVKQLGFQLLLESRGLMNTSTIALLTKSILRDQMLQKGKEYSYMIEFTNKHHETHHGVNVTYLIRLDVFLKFNLKREDQSFLSKINIFKDGEKWEERNYLDFEAKKSHFKLQTNQANAGLYSSDSTVIYMAFVFIACIVLFILITIVDYAPIFIGIGLGLMAIFLSYFFIENFFIGPITVGFKDIEKGVFQVTTQNNNRWQYVHHLSLSYVIVEEVTDKRGTSVTTETASLYTSKRQHYQNPHDNILTIFDYPKLSISELPPNRIDDVRIYWLLQLKVTTRFGLSFHYTTEFSVKKIYN